MTDDVVDIACQTLDTALASADDSHPSKFVAHLRATDARDLDVDSDGRLLTEIVFAPESGSRRGDVFRVLGVDAVPRSASIVGTVASAPSGELEGEDYTRFTNRGRVHVVVFPPYDEGSWRAYGSDGAERELRTFDVEFDETVWLDVLSPFREA
ncbi:MAG: proteasome lid subunit RPN8/RPN11 [Methanobacteriota archaeon]|jgi:proteasome lid subunit RPN8/RPN11